VSQMAKDAGSIGILNAFQSLAFFNASITSRLRFLVACFQPKVCASHAECLSERMAYRSHRDLHDACRLHPVS
jgi:hypothetical protein